MPNRILRGISFKESLLWVVKTALVSTMRIFCQAWMWNWGNFYVYSVLGVKWVLIPLCQIMLKLVIPAGKRVSSAMDGKLKYIHGTWIPAQICPEQICINPKGIRQDSLMWIHAGMTILENSDHVIWQSRTKRRLASNRRLKPHNAYRSELEIIYLRNCRWLVVSSPGAGYSKTLWMPWT